MPHRARIAASVIARAVGAVTLAGFTPPPAGVMPTVKNTGIPMGLSIPTSVFAYFGEGLTDTRPSETASMVAATPTSVPGMSAPDATGLSYLPVTAVQSYDHIDFTNVKLVIGAAVTSLTFTKCLFRCTSAALQDNWARGTVLNYNGNTTATTLNDCTMIGALPDPNFAISHFIGATNGDTTVQRCNISGFSTLMDCGASGICTFDSNYCHDPVINKVQDVAPYTNQATWAHIDGFQIGATNQIGTLRVTNNTLLAFSATVQIATGPLQIGQMAAPAPAKITSFVFDGNYVDGGSYIVGANVTTAISVTTRLEITNNKVGLNYAYGIDGGNSIHPLATLWAGNTYFKTGTAGNVGGRGTVGAQYQVAVTAGQSIP